MQLVRTAMAQRCWWSLGCEAVVLAQSAYMYLHLHLGYDFLAIADHHICLLQVTGSCN